MNFLSLLGLQHASYHQLVPEPIRDRMYFHWRMYMFRGHILQEVLRFYTLQ